jgi:hypothetical protein
MDAAEVCSALYYSLLAGMEEVSDCLLHTWENANAEGGTYVGMCLARPEAKSRAKPSPNRPGQAGP